MNFSLNNLKFQNKVSLNNTLPKSGEIVLEKVSQLDEFMKALIKKIKDSSSAKEVDKMLLDISKNPEELEMLDYILFKHKDYNILTCMNHVGETIIKNLKTLEKLELSCVPDLVTSINKDNSLYIIMRHKGTQTGKLKPYFVDGIEKVATDAKLKAYMDLQKLTKAGLVDEQNLRAGNWFYTPENKIFLPNWNSLRSIRPDESQKGIIEQYYNTIFGK